MPRLEYFLVARSVSIDQDRNEVSVFGILEEISLSKSDPKVLPEMEALASWILDPEDQGTDFLVTLQLVGPGPGQCPSDGEFSVAFTAKGSRQRTRLGFVGMPIDRAGDTRFILKLNGVEKATHILTVHLNDEE
jgi:hypothetical protein